MNFKIIKKQNSEIILKFLEYNYSEFFRTSLGLFQIIFWHDKMNFDKFSFNNQFHQ